MPEIVERGHLYIAQPPLFKVKRGKQEQYLKNDAELEQFVVKNGLDGVRLEPAEGTTLAGEQLISACGKKPTLSRLLGQVAASR